VFRTAPGLTSELQTARGKTRRLPRVALEVLVVIAFYPPIPRPEIEWQCYRYSLSHPSRRFEAYRCPKRPPIFCCRRRLIADITKAMLWEPSENLHRAELSTLEHSERIAEWVKLTEQVKPISAQLVPKSPESPVDHADQPLFDLVRTNQNSLQFG
jgi:hypothetical protein